MSESEQWQWNFRYSQLFRMQKQCNRTISLFQSTPLSTSLQLNEINSQTGTTVTTQLIPKARPCRAKTTCDNMKFQLFLGFLLVLALAVESIEVRED